MAFFLKFPRPRSWRAFCVLAGVLFFARGLFLLCLYPPLEGYDEYQHIAYMEYLNDYHAVPVYGRASVPESLFGDLVRNPHCKNDWMQTRRIGCRRYEFFYDKKVKEPGKAKIRLYQAQHPPLYYRAFAPLYGFVKERFGFRQSVYLLRMIDIALAAAALALFLGPLKRVFKPLSRAKMCGLAVSLLPMYLVYVSRVCNDALALLFAAAAFALLAGITDDRRLFVKSAAVGLLVGAGVLTKLLVIVFLPVAGLYLLFLKARGRISLPKAAAAGLLAAAAYLLVSFHYHIESYRAFGTPFPAQETIENTAAGKTVLDLVREIRPDHFRRFLVPVVRTNLWASGWSYLHPAPLLTSLYFWLLLFFLAGMLPGLVRAAQCRRRRTERAPPAAGGGGFGFRTETLFLCFLTFAFTVLALYAHSLNSLAAYGALQVVCYYAMIGFPAFLTLALAALEGYGSKRLAFAGAAALGLLFAVTEIHSSIFIAVPHFTAAGDFHLAWERLVSIHPAFPSPAYAVPALAAVVLLLAAALRSVFDGE